MGIVSLPSFGSDPATITAALLDGKVDPLATEFNGSIDNDNIKASAGIVYSKLNLTGNVLNADISTSAAIASSKLNLGTVAQNIVMSSKAIEWAKGGDLASAGTMNFGTATGNYFDITGTTSIVYLGTSQAGSTRVVQFDGVLTLTHDATQLILPTGADITTAAGDVAIFTSEGSGNWRCVAYTRADGTTLGGITTASLPAGTVLQTVVTQSSTVASGTTVMPVDGTIPQITEGDEYMTRTITASSTSNKLIVDICAKFATSAAGAVGFALFQDSTANAVAGWHSKFASGSEEGTTLFFRHIMDAGTVSETTLRFRAGPASGTLYFNSRDVSGNQLYTTGVGISSMTIQEVKV